MPNSVWNSFCIALFTLLAHSPLPPHHSTCTVGLGSPFLRRAVASLTGQTPSTSQRMYVFRALASTFADQDLRHTEARSQPPWGETVGLSCCPAIPHSDHTPPPVTSLAEQASVTDAQKPLSNFVSSEIRASETARKRNAVIKAQACCTHCTYSTQRCATGPYKCWQQRVLQPTRTPASRSHAMRDDPPTAGASFLLLSVCLAISFPEYSLSDA